MPGPVLMIIMCFLIIANRSGNVLSLLTLTTTDITAEETKAQRSQMTCPRVQRDGSEPASQCLDSSHHLQLLFTRPLGHSKAKPVPFRATAPVPLGGWVRLQSEGHASEGMRHEGSPRPHLSADVHVIVLWFQVHFSDRHGLHLQPAILFLVLSVPLYSPFQQLQVKVLLMLPLATE